MAGKCHSALSRILIERGIQMALNYKIEATVTPTQGTSGGMVKMNAALTEVEGEISAVYASVVNQGMQFRLMLQEDGTYAASTTIPWGAPSGSYTISVYAIDAERQKGPEKSLQFRVI